MKYPQKRSIKTWDDTIMLSGRRILTADLQVRRLFVLPDGAACCAEVLARVRVRDILQGEGRHASVAPHHHISIQALEESRYFSVKNQRTQTFTSAEQKHLKGKKENPSLRTNITLIKKGRALCSEDVDTQGHSWGYTGEMINNLCQKAPKTSHGFSHGGLATCELRWRR